MNKTLIIILALLAILSIYYLFNKNNNQTSQPVNVSELISQFTNSEFSAEQVASRASANDDLDSELEGSGEYYKEYRDDTVPSYCCKWGNLCPDGQYILPHLGLDQVNGGAHNFVPVVNQQYNQIKNEENIFRLNEILINNETAVIRSIKDFIKEINNIKNTATPEMEESWKNKVYNLDESFERLKTIFKYFQQIQDPKIKTKGIALNLKNFVNRNAFTRPIWMAVSKIASTIQMNDICFYTEQAVIQFRKIYMTFVESFAKNTGVIHRILQLTMQDNSIKTNEEKIELKTKILNAISQKAPFSLGYYSFISVSKSHWGNLISTLGSPYEVGGLYIAMRREEHPWKTGRFYPIIITPEIEPDLNRQYLPDSEADPDNKLFIDSTLIKAFDIDYQYWPDIIYFTGNPETDILINDFFNPTYNDDDAAAAREGERSPGLLTADDIRNLYVYKNDIPNGQHTYEKIPYQCNPIEHGFGYGTFWCSIKDNSPVITDVTYANPVEENKLIASKPQHVVNMRDNLLDVLEIYETDNQELYNTASRVIDGLISRGANQDILDQLPKYINEPRLEHCLHDSTEPCSWDGLNSWREFDMTLDLEDDDLGGDGDTTMQTTLLESLLSIYNSQSVIDTYDNAKLSHPNKLLVYYDQNSYDSNGGWCPININVPETTDLTYITDSEDKTGLQTQIIIKFDRDITEIPFRRGQAERVKFIEIRDKTDDEIADCENNGWSLCTDPKVTDLAQENVSIHLGYNGDKSLLLIQQGSGEAPDLGYAAYDAAQYSLGDSYWDLYAGEWDEVADNGNKVILESGKEYEIYIGERDDGKDFDLPQIVDIIIPNNEEDQEFPITENKYIIATDTAAGRTIRDPNALRTSECTGTHPLTCTGTNQTNTDKIIIIQ